MPNRLRTEYRIAWLASMMVDALQGAMLPAVRVRVAARVIPDVGAVTRGSAPPPGGVALTIDLDMAGGLKEEAREFADALRRLLDPPYRVELTGDHVRVVYSAGWPPTKPPPTG